MIEWTTDDRIVVDGVPFVLAPVEVNKARADVAAGNLLLRKARWMVERYVEVASIVRGGNIVELGIYEGGSTALLALLCQPRHLVAFDLKARSPGALDRFIRDRDLSGTVHPHYGIDQADRAALTDVLAAELGDEPLDLVIDDASHLLAESTHSFNILFPRLRPGGLYILEDWSWGHESEALLEREMVSDPALRERVFQLVDERGVDPEGPPMSRLLLEIILASAYTPDVVAEVTSVRAGWAVVRRGPVPLGADFDISVPSGRLGRLLLGDR